VSSTAVRGFSVAAVAAGIGPGDDIGVEAGPDLALVVNHGPRLDAAALFTGEGADAVAGAVADDAAAPVLWSRQVLTGGRVSAVALNSGCANAGTGPQGFQATHATAERVAAALDAAAPGASPEAGHSAGEVLVCSTGPAGVQLPLDRVLSGVDAAVAALVPYDEQAPRAFGSAGVARDGWTVGGLTWGSGPGALTVLTTDAELPAAALEDALRDAPGGTVLLLASGASGTAPGADAFADAVRAVRAALTTRTVSARTDSATS
jgi:glutamate N-acetyltransferase/amino-acid N-acetyltransferase